MMLRGDARKRLHPEPLPHHDPAVVALIEAAREQGRIEGWNAHAQAIHEDARRVAVDAAGSCICSEDAYNAVGCSCHAQHRRLYLATYNPWRTDQ